MFVVLQVQHFCFSKKTLEVSYSYNHLCRCYHFYFGFLSLCSIICIWDKLIDFNILLVALTFDPQILHTVLKWSVLCYSSYIAMYSCFHIEGILLLKCLSLVAPFFNLAVIWINICKYALLVKWIQIFTHVNSYGASDGYPSQHGITKDAQVFVQLMVILTSPLLLRF